jgi:hypothetical protein
VDAGVKGCGDIKWPEGRKVELAEIAAVVVKKFRLEQEVLQGRND